MTQGMTSGLTQGDLLMIVSVAACLVLALRGLRARRLGSNRVLVMGIVWAVIIAGLAYAMQRFAP
jgi:MFS-type transporter involved in bile tolerance (Atg22 family)